MNEIETSKPKTKYDQKKYYENFKIAHADNINKKTICTICGGSYSYFNKSCHLKSKKHNKKITPTEQAII